MYNNKPVLYGGTGNGLVGDSFVAKSVIDKTIVKALQNKRLFFLFIFSLYCKVETCEFLY